MREQITIPVRLDAETYRRFCFFDDFRRQRRWYLPVMVSMSLIAVSMVLLFGVRSGHEGLAGLLMGLGLAIPMVVFGLYCIQILARTAEQDLKNKPLIYTVTLERAGVRVVNGRKPEPPVELPWTASMSAFRRRGAVYLYVNAGRALILPDGQADAADDEVWSFLQKHAGACLDMRRKP